MSRHTRPLPARVTTALARQGDRPGTAGTPRPRAPRVTARRAAIAEQLA